MCKNIKPCVTLYHWDLPQRLQNIGGWTNPLMADYFADYARIVFEAFGDRVKIWQTFNELKTFCDTYSLRDPLVTNLGTDQYLCAHTVIKAHAKVYHLYDKYFRNSQQGRISIALDCNWKEPASNMFQDIEASERAMQFELGWFAHPIYSLHGDYPEVMKEYIAVNSKLEGYPRSRLPKFTQEEIEYIKGTSDFFGFNHYSTSLTKAPPFGFRFSSFLSADAQAIQYQPIDWFGSASNWIKVVPWGFTKILRWIREEYNNPEVMIFENGISDEGGLNDNARIDYISSYLNALLDAVEEGSNITAYTVWSFMDNFEWLDGYRTRFGLYQVDLDHPCKTRVPKKSAYFYSSIIRNKSIEKNPSDCYK